jgi:arylsulfatase
MAGDCNQWYRKLYRGREPIDQPALPEEGYHLSEDLIDQSTAFLNEHAAAAPEKPWLLYLAFGAMHAPHHVAPEWIEKY